MEVGSGRRQFKTAAMSSAGPGDVIGMMTNTYRNTYIPTNSGTTGLPIIIQAVSGETPVITGLNEVGDSGWTVHSGSIYKKTISLPVTGFNVRNSPFSNTQLFSNQIFKDGVMQIEARWPKITTIDDQFDQSKLRQKNNTTEFTASNITDSALGGLPSLIGARLMVQGWFYTNTASITNHVGNRITYGSGISGNHWFRRLYWVTGKLNLLTNEKEWHYEVGVLYFRQTGGGSPTGLEYKARNYGFNLTGKSNITIRGVTFKGCDPVWSDTDTNHNTVLDNIDATFMNHNVADLAFVHPGGGNWMKTGTRLIGNNCVIKNSRMSYSASTEVWAGENCRVENNHIHHIGYEGNWGAPVNMWDRKGGIKVLRNSLHDCGRSCVDFGWHNHNSITGTHGEHLNCEIGYNRMYRFGRTNWDGGATYAHGHCYLLGLEIHHNWIWDNLSPNLDEAGGQNGIYFDQLSGPGNIHHNVLWNIPNSDVYHETSDAPNYPTGNPMNWYNNTFASTDVTNTANSSYRTYEVSPLDVQRNNIYWRRIVINWSAGNYGNTSHSVFPVGWHPQGANPLFTGTNKVTQEGLYFQIASNSPARNIGTTSFAGWAAYPSTVTINVPAIGAGLDAGAYDYDDPDPWVAGHVDVPYESNPVTTLYIDNFNNPANVYTGVWSHVNNAAWTQGHINKTLSYTYEVNATLTTAFTGNKVEWFAEKRVNHGIVAVSIDGGAETMVDLYENVTTNTSTKVFEEDLVQGNHTIRLRLTSTPNPLATENNATHDAFKIYTE